MITYSAGELIYFDPFHFKSGKESKPKYFLVLKVINSSVIITSLHSSMAHLPASQQILHGCLEIPDSGINCYVFEALKPITLDGWSFPLHTFCY
ncbi:MAG TPA: hypothetical protein VGG71_00440 [Chitinophagaceae bacterium]